jgi:di/tricarboxylate transporter
MSLRLARVSVRPIAHGGDRGARGVVLTPVATPVDLMVMGPGGYRFGHYWRRGLPLLLLFVAVATLVVPVFLPL